MLNLLYRTSLVLSTLSLFAVSAAFGAPKVGDSTTLDGKLAGHGIDAKITTFQKITAHNANTDVFSVQQTQTVMGQSQTTEIQVAASDLVSEETAATIVEGCETQSMGKKERVTVRAGTFDTCQMTNEDGTLLWMAPVPFGVVKLQTKIPAGIVSLEMSAFTRGQ